MLQPRVIICFVLFSVLFYSCEKPGCTHPESFNYNPDANLEDGSCVPKVFGCMDTASINYVPTANTDDGTCIPKVYGCMNPVALNYNPDANVDDGSCICNREMFYGTYDITSNCTNLPNGSPDTTQYVMEIYADSSNYCKVTIFNFRNYGLTKSCFVSGNNILVPSSSNFDETFGYYTTYHTTITLSGDSLYINYLTELNYDPIINCDMIGIKQ